jgi:hypothetical protein
VCGNSGRDLNLAEGCRSPVGVDVGVAVAGVFKRDFPADEPWDRNEGEQTDKWYLDAVLTELTSELRRRGPAPGRRYVGDFLVLFLNVEDSSPACQETCTGILHCTHANQEVFKC